MKRIGVIQGTLDGGDCLDLPLDRGAPQDAAEMVAGQLGKPGFSAQAVPARIAAEAVQKLGAAKRDSANSSKACVGAMIVTERLGLDGLLVVREKQFTTLPALNLISPGSDLPGYADESIRGALSGREGNVVWTGTVDARARGQTGLLGVLVGIPPSLAGPSYQARSHLAAMLAGKVRP